MKNITSRISVVFASLIMVSLVSGCGGASEETLQYETTVKAPGTLTLTTKDSEKGLISGTFENDGYTIRFDVARGEENPLSERLVAGAPSHAIDVRICDEKHFCFAQQAGGHAFADTSWVADNSEANVPDDIRAKKNIKIRREFHQKLYEVGSKEFSGLREEYQSLLDASGNSESSYLNEIPLSDTPLSETPQKGVLSLVSATVSATYTQQHVMRKIGIFFGSIAGDHSASLIRTYTASGTWLTDYWTCNHGTCGNSNTMNNYCIRNYTNRPLALPINTRCDAGFSPGTMHPVGPAGCCTTQYNFTGISHVCNDDTRLQRDFMISGGPMSAVYCGDTVLARYAPSCI